MANVIVDIGQAREKNKHQELTDIYKVAVDKNSNISVYKIDLYRYKSTLLNIKSIILSFTKS